MFSKNLDIGFLLDFYGDVLDEHTRTILQLYYGEDLSLSEIAELEGISRQGVRHVIKKGEEQLTFLEARLGLAKRFNEIEKIAEELTALSKEIAKMDAPCGAQLSERILRCAESINK